MDKAFHARQSWNRGTHGAPITETRRVSYLYSDQFLQLAGASGGVNPVYGTGLPCAGATCLATVRLDIAGLQSQ